MALEGICNVKKVGQVWEQASLPVRYEVVGVRRMGEIMLPAFLISIHSVMPVISELRPGTVAGDVDCGALERWLLVIGAGLPILEKRGCQKEWDELICAIKLRSMLDFPA